MSPVRLIGLAVLLAVLAAAAPAGSASKSGLYGVVTKGPIRPVCTVDKPCDAPARVTLLFFRGGHQAARARSAADGRYRVALAPGIYSVGSVERIGLGKAPSPHRVKVRRGRWDRIDLSFDTGIR